MGEVDQDFLEYMLMMNLLQEDAKNLIVRHNKKDIHPNLGNCKIKNKKNNKKKETA